MTHADAHRAVAAVCDDLETDDIDVVETRDVCTTRDEDVAHATVVLELPLDEFEAVDVPAFDSLTSNQQTVVEYIATHDRVETSDIEAGSDVSWPASVVRQLRNKHVVESSPHPDDGRRHVHTLTEAAEKAYADEFAAEDETAGSQESEPDDSAGAGGRAKYDPEEWAPEESKDDVVAAIDQSETLSDIADELGVSTEKTLRLLGHFDLDRHILGDGTLVDLDEVEKVSAEVGR